MIRFFDVLFSLIGLVFLSPLLILIFFIGLFEDGSPLLYKIELVKSLNPFH